MNNRLITVLLIEDNPGDAGLIRAALSEAKGGEFALEWVERLSAGIERLESGGIDIVLLDLSLPDSRGLETLRKIQTAAPDIPVVVLTGLDDETIALNSVQAGAQDYLVKGDMAGNLLARAIRYAIERQRMQVAMQSLSLVDDLTGLFNRRGFLTLAQQEMKTAERINKPVLIVFCDMDELKSINDTLGHQEGDRAICAAAEVIRNTFREPDIVARLGGDEFAVYAMLNIDIDENILKNRLEQNLEERNRKGDLPFLLSISIGIVRNQAGSPGNIEDLLKEADRRMYEEKHLHKLRVVAKVSNG